MKAFVSPGDLKRKGERGRGRERERGGGERERERLVFPSFTQTRNAQAHAA
jgi:hypothetical protein